MRAKRPSQQSNLMHASCETFGNCSPSMQLTQSVGACHFVNPRALRSSSSPSCVPGTASNGRQRPAPAGPGPQVMIELAVMSACYKRIVATAPPACHFLHVIE